MATDTRPTRRPVMLPGHSAPAAGLEAPFEMLAACHDRVERMLALQGKLQRHLLDKGCDGPARQAARDVMRYFDLAAPLHHQDEELHVFPPLLAGPDAGLRKLVQRLVLDHRHMETAWLEARRTLQAIAVSPAFGGLPLTPVQTVALDQFAALYRGHLDDENSIVYPAAQAMLPPGAVQGMSEDMMQRRGVHPQRQPHPPAL
ncbi:hemerythrin domain-containing protein [Polaromonas sp. CG_9.11]|uniref:hemerythrin domain-containing protein n=1 Tax=Polaromonas sp. CG_9.11 TaxID=2787730 RepID=UPI001A29820C|nr:hemerythrin domain-containing protein [Polaromonas sp. CG_9.11]MBG6076699.1 hemerythrin-like domain-containing protein [Polaromonas sp. CG_9.11]